MNVMARKYWGCFMRFFNEDLKMFVSVVRTKLVGISRSRVLNISPILFKRSLLLYLSWVFLRFGDSLSLEKLNLFHSQKVYFQIISRVLLEYFSFSQKTFPCYGIGQNYENSIFQPFSSKYPINISILWKRSNFFQWGERGNIMSAAVWLLLLLSLCTRI